jgi:cystathionine gamma-synthase
VYPSGQSALTTLLLAVKPKRVVCQPHGYHGSQSIFSKFVETNDIALKTGIIDCEFQSGDFIHIESPKNPTLELMDIEAICKRARAVPGCTVVVDSTFAPPPLFDAFQYDIDFVYTSATKYLGGHSDVLAGILVSSPKKPGWGHKLQALRSIHGNVLGALETWLLLRSLRTLELRVRKQSENATLLAKHLSKDTRIAKTWHTSVRDHPQFELAKGMFPNGHPGILSIELHTEVKARRLVKFCNLFKDATSLGGVESTMDYRYRWDSGISPTLIRVSIGIEEFEDLKKDIDQALDKLDLEPVQSVSLMKKLDVGELIKAKFLYDAYDSLCEKKLITHDIAQQEQTKLILNSNDAFTLKELKDLDVAPYLKGPVKPKIIVPVPWKFDLLGWGFEITFYVSLLVLIYCLYRIFTVDLRK